MAPEGDPTTLIPIPKGDNDETLFNNVDDAMAAVLTQLGRLKQPRGRNIVPHQIPTNMAAANAPRNPIINYLMNAYGLIQHASFMGPCMKETLNLQFLNSLKWDPFNPPFS